MSIGAVNAISAVVADDPAKPKVRTRRTALTFDDAGRPRIGAINEFASAITDFADLTRESEPMVMGGRFYSATNLIAAVVTGLIELAEPPAGIVLTYPAVYTDKQVSLLGQALHLAGAGEVLLVPEPVAAAEWLEIDHGPLESGFVLVYDLGATSLDLTVLRVGPDWSHHPMVGTPTRSADFGGRPLGEMVARYAGAPGIGRATQTLTSMVNIDALRAEHIRDTFPLVSNSVSAAGLRLADLSRILVVGGAARPPEVARTLAELGVPLVTVADPGQVIASGAAGLAARTFAPEQQTGGPAPHVAVFSSAAVVSALAMSAMTVFGSPFDPGLMPVLDRFPVLGSPVDALLYDMSADLLADRTSGLLSEVDPATGRIRVAGVAAARSAYENFIAPATVLGGESRPGAGADRGAPGRRDARADCKSPILARATYGNPARFTNPLPFGRQVAQTRNSSTEPGAPELPHGGGAIPAAGTPEAPGTPTSPGTLPAVDSATTHGTSTPASGTSMPSKGGATTEVGGSAPAGGTDSGTTPSSHGTPTGGATSGGTPAGGPAHGGTTGGGTSGGTDTSGGGASDNGASNGGGTGGGGASGGGASEGGGSGDASGGGASNGGGTGGGGASGGGAPGGGASDNGASNGGGTGGGGASGGGASGGGASTGAPSGGASGGGASGGGASGGGASGGGASNGGASGGGAPGGTSSRGKSSSGASSGGTSSGGGLSGGSKGGASSGGSGGGGGGGGSRR